MYYIGWLEVHNSESGGRGCSRMDRGQMGKQSGRASESTERGLQRDRAETSGFQTEQRELHTTSSSTIVRSHFSQKFISRKTGCGCVSKMFYHTSWFYFVINLGSITCV